MCNLQLTRDPDAEGIFAIQQATGNLVTAWHGAALPPGFYAVGIQANALACDFSDTAEFQINIT